MHTVLTQCCHHATAGTPSFPTYFILPFVRLLLAYSFPITGTREVALQHTLGSRQCSAHVFKTTLLLVG